MRRTKRGCRRHSFGAPITDRIRRQRPPDCQANCLAFFVFASTGGGGDRAKWWGSSRRFTHDFFQVIDGFEIASAGDDPQR